jgi:hypothetical protein
LFVIETIAPLLVLTLYTYFVIISNYQFSLVFTSEVQDFKTLVFTSDFKGQVLTGSCISHRGLKLDGAIGQGEICNSLKSEIFSKSFQFHIGKNKIKF